MPSPWSLPKRIAFRFAFAYLVLYNLPFPLDAPVSLSFAERVSDAWDGMWSSIVQPVGKAVFGVDAALRPNGGGDAMFNFVQLFCCAAIALAVTLIWSLLDRRRED